MVISDAPTVQDALWLRDIAGMIPGLNTENRS